MSEFKGTPKTGSNWAININNPAQTLIENVCIIDEGWHLPEVKADAYLISSAPDLLEALQKVYGLIKQCGIEEDMDIEEVDYIGNAINKALGL